MRANQLGKFSEKLRVLSGLFLITTLLVLGSCPLKKAFYLIISGAPDTEQALAGPGKTLATAVCSSLNSLNKNLILLEREINTSTPLYSFILLTGFFIRPVKRNALWYQRASAPEPCAVPLYLKNRLLRI